VTVVVPFENPDRRSPILTPEQIHQVLIKASLFDGRTVGQADVAGWHEIAVEQRWRSLPLVMAAVRNYYGRPAKQGERLWIMPGHVTEYVRSDSQHPEPFSEVHGEIGGPPPAADERRAEAVRRFAESVGRSPEQIEQERTRARAELTKARVALWAAVDACDLCDDGGMRVDAGDLVCDHSTPDVAL
jgi:hypothetical protein